MIITSNYPDVDDFLDKKYRYKAVQISHDIGLGAIPYIVWPKILSTLGIEPAPNPVIGVQNSMS